MSEITEIKITPVKTLRQALQMRIIRNNCRLYMTGDNSEIGFFRQIRWFYQNYKPLFEKKLLKAWLLYYDGELAGYGMIRDRSVITLGIFYKYRGYGLGKRLFAHLLKFAKDPRLEVLKWNKRAIHIYKKFGFKKTGASQTTLFMERVGNGHEAGTK